MSMNSNETIGNRTRDLPACGAVPQPTAPPHALFLHECKCNYLSWLRSNAGRTLLFFGCSTSWNSIHYSNNGWTSRVSTDLNVNFATATSIKRTKHTVWPWQERKTFLFRSDGCLCESVLPILSCFSLPQILFRLRHNWRDFVCTQSVNAKNTPIINGRTLRSGVGGDAVGGSTAIQAGRSRVWLNVTEIFHLHSLSGRTVVLGSTQPLTEMSTRGISWGAKSAGA